MDATNKKISSDWNSYWQKAAGYKEHPSIAWDLMDDDKAGYLLECIGGKRGTLLEVGCGTARMSTRLARLSFNTICLDKSLPALPLARNNFLENDLRFTGLAGDGYRLPFPDGTFDGVLSTGLLEHFEDPQPLLKEMVRVAKKGGFVYADILPKKTWRLLLMLDFIRNVLGRYTDDLKEMPFSGSEIRNMVVISGLKDEIIFPAGIYWPRCPVLRGSRWLVGLENMMCRLTHPLFKPFDRTFGAEIFGVYYFVFGRK